MTLTQFWADFITACCKVEPEERITADEALRHPWLVNELSRGTHHIGDNVRNAFRDRIDRTGSLVESDRTRDLEPHEREESRSSSSTAHEQEVCILRYTCYCLDLMKPIRHRWREPSAIRWRRLTCLRMRLPPHRHKVCVLI